ncbi:MAG: DUF192 domain-containing protein [Patescibacteria group bacterium]|nr:DUF192 domain-containing protein [Patescibacteria group bacterium]
MPRYLIFIFLGTFLALSILLFKLPGPKTVNSSLGLVIIGNSKIYVKVAKTPGQLAKGLGGISSLPENEGMLFVMGSFFRHSFWMKGMEFPLDFVWIKDSKVVDLTQNVPVSSLNLPPVIQPKTECNFVLEVNAGTISRKNWQIGDSVRFKLQ